MTTYCKMTHFFEQDGQRTSKSPWNFLQSAAFSLRKNKSWLMALPNLYRLSWMLTSLRCWKTGSIHRRMLKTAPLLIAGWLSRLMPLTNRSISFAKDLCDFSSRYVTSILQRNIPGETLSFRDCLTHGANRFILDIVEEKYACIRVSANKETARLHFL